MFERSILAVVMSEINFKKIIGIRDKIHRKKMEGKKIERKSICREKDEKK